MALELISQVLSSTNATYINGVSAERKFATATLKNLYQGLIEKDGRGINDKFVTEDDANTAAQVFVNRILPVKMKPREQGASKNGASFSQNQHYVQTVTVGIEILQIVDDTITIPRVRQDWIKVDLLAEEIEIYSDRLATILNGATAASKLLASWEAEANGYAVNKYTLTDPGLSTDNKQILKQFIYANSLLDLGDESNGIDIFPVKTRIAVFKPTWRAPLKVSGVLQLGGANYAYDILKGGAISHESRVSTEEDGYIGELDGIPCHLISNESLQHASEFLGFYGKELLTSSFVGYIASSYANARGVSVAKQTKIVDAQNGQGIILQPLTKFGVKSWYPKGNVILSDVEGGYNPIKALKDYFSGVTVVFKLKGAGSRLYPVVPTTGAWTVSATGFTLAGVSAKDDFGTEHFVAAYYYVGTAAVAAGSLNDFINKAKAATYKGAVVLAAPQTSTTITATTTIANGEFVNVLLIADDGSIAITSVKADL